MSKIINCLWFDKQAEEAAEFYVSVLPDTRIIRKVQAPTDYPLGKRGDLLLVEMTIVGQPTTLLNGGPYFKLSEAFSLQLMCDDQAEVDRYFAALSAVPECEQCGWIKDKYGLSWQLIPTRYLEIMRNSDLDTQERVMKAMLEMKKLDLAAIEAAAKG